MEGLFGGKWSALSFLSSPSSPQKLSSLLPNNNLIISKNSSKPLTLIN